MKTTVKRGNKKRLKSVKEGKRDVAKVSRARWNENYKYPIDETLDWLNDGEKLLRKWGAIKSPGARRIANAVSNILGILKTINELRKS